MKSCSTYSRKASASSELLLLVVQRVGVVAVCYMCQGASKLLPFVCNYLENC